MSQTLEKQKKITNYLIQTCSHCHHKMSIREGTVLFDGKWYHGNCWQFHAAQDQGVN